MKKGQVLSDIIGVLIMASVLVFGIAIMNRCELKFQAIKRGYAEYNQTTGAWQWKEVTK